MKKLILTKSELLEIIDEDIEKAKELWTELKTHQLDTESVEYKLDRLQFMYSYIEKLEDINDLEDDKQESFNNI